MKAIYSPTNSHSYQWFHLCLHTLLQLAVRDTCIYWQEHVQFRQHFDPASHAHVEIFDFYRGNQQISMWILSTQFRLIFMIGYSCSYVKCCHLTTIKSAGIGFAWYLNTSKVVVLMSLSIAENSQLNNNLTMLTELEKAFEICVLCNA